MVIGSLLFVFPFHRHFVFQISAGVVQFRFKNIKGSCRRVGGIRSKERDRKSELVLRSTCQIFEWDRNNSDRNFYNVVRYVHIPLVP